MTSPGPEGEPGPASRAAVKAQLPQGGAGVPDLAIDGIVAAVNDRVTDWIETDRLTSPATVLGANMLAARLVARRNSPAGVATFGSEGLTAYVVRNDPDVALLLKLGPYAVPRVG